MDIIGKFNFDIRFHIKKYNYETSLSLPLQTWISEAMLEVEGGWGKRPK